MAEAKSESPTSGTPSKITDFFTNRQQLQASPVTCITDCASLPDTSPAKSMKDQEVFTDFEEHSYSAKMPRTLDFDTEKCHTVSWESDASENCMTDMRDTGNREAAIESSALDLGFQKEPLDYSMPKHAADLSMPETVDQPQKPANPHLTSMASCPFGTVNQNVFVAQNPTVRSGGVVVDGQNVYVVQDSVNGIAGGYKFVSAETVRLYRDVQNPSIVYCVNERGLIVSAFVTNFPTMPLICNPGKISSLQGLQNCFTPSQGSGGLTTYVYPTGYAHTTGQSTGTQNFVHGHCQQNCGLVSSFTQRSSQSSHSLSLTPKIENVNKRRARKKLLADDWYADENVDVSLSGPKKPRKGGGRAPARSGKTSATGTKLPLTEASQTLPNGDSPARQTVSEAKTVSRAKSKTSGARPKSVTSTKPKIEAVPQSKEDTSSTKIKQKEADTKESEPQKSITDFFPVRRSNRRFTSRELKKEREKDMKEKILQGCEEGLEVKEIEGKGRGVLATREFEKDEFVVEYAGELVNITTAKQRENLYERDEEVGCYMYYFMHKNKQYCIDATAESGKLGRLLNHSRKGNCYTKVVAIDDRPYLVLLAARHIEPGEELTYDYGDRSQKALESHPWLKY